MIYSSLFLSDIPKAYLSKFELWNNLPNEVKALIVQEMDVKTRSSFKRCGKNEAELVRKYGKSDVNIRVQMLEDELCRENVMIELKDAKLDSVQLKWFIRFESIYTSDSSPQKPIRSFENFTAALNIIIQQLLTEPMFVVKKLEFQLEKYEGYIHIPVLHSNSVECLVLNKCFQSQSIRSILKSEHLNFKAIVGVTREDVEGLYTFYSAEYGKPRTICNDILYPIYDSLMRIFCSSLQPSNLYNFESAHRKLTIFWRLTLDRYNFNNEKDRIDKLKDPKTTIDLMYFRAAYSYQSNCVPFLRQRKEYERNIKLLREGIDGYLNDYQLTILFIAYLVRLFRNEPEIEKIYNTAFEDLKLSVERYKSFNCYEKLVSKIELIIASL